MSRCTSSAWALQDRCSKDACITRQRPPQPPSLQALVTGIPINGTTLYARIYSLISGAWQYNDYTYTAFGTAVPAALTFPTPETKLTGSSATFNWSAGTGVTLYEFRLGTTGPGSKDLYNSAEATTTALTSGPVTGIPNNGATLYARSNT